MKLEDLYKKHNTSYVLMNGMPISFDDNFKRILVSVSGGADSALLLYLLSTIIDNKKLDVEVNVVSHVRMWITRPWQKYDSLNVFNFMVKKFPNIKYIRHENFISPEIEYGTIGPIIRDKYGRMKSGDQISIRSHAEYLCRTLSLDAFYGAMTKNPDVKIPGAPDDRNAKLHIDSDFSFLVQEEDGLKVFHPFRYTSKDELFKLYKYYNIKELFDITRSCEGEFSELTYKNYTPGQYVPICGNCFWCLERAYAVNQ